MECIRRALVLGLVLIAGTAIGQALSVGPPIEQVTSVGVLLLLSTHSHDPC